MDELDTFTKESDDALKDPRYAVFDRVGSWQASLRFSPRWIDERTFQNELVAACNRSKVFDLASGQTPQAENYVYEGDKREVYRAEVINDAGSFARFWRVKYGGLAYYRRTYRRFVADKPPPAVIDRRYVVNDVREVLSYLSLITSDPREIRLRWEGLQGRTLVDSTAARNLDTFESASSNVAEINTVSPPGISHGDLQGEPAIRLVHYLTVRLFEAFGFRPTVDDVKRWL
jgi:hypothetical protein